MSEHCTFAGSAIDAESFLSALAVGALDACLAFLGGADRGATPAEAAWDCRLAEALLHADRRDDAVECCRRAFPRIGKDTAALRICAWVFSNCGQHDEAAQSYQRLIDLYPEDAELYYHASFSLAAAGRRDEAAAVATTASGLAASCAEFARNAGVLLREAKRHDEAACFFDRALALAPADNRLRIDAAEGLIASGRAVEAVGLLRGAPAVPADPRLLRVLSAAEMLCGRVEVALAVIDDALAVAPQNAEYHVHRGHLLWRLGDLAGAAAALARAAVLDPVSAELKRAQMGLYLAAGLVSQATAVGGELLYRFPDDGPSAEAVMHLLSQRLDAIDGECVVLSNRAERAQRPTRPAVGLGARMCVQGRVIGALIIRETRTRFADSKLGYGWALVEPILHIRLLSVVFAVLMHGRPPIGADFFVFYYTGLVPYHVFVHASSGMSHAITGNAPLLQLPPVTTFDAIAARGLLEVMTDIVVAVLLLAGFGAIGLAAMPDDLWGPAIALVVTAALGCGVGFVNAVLTTFVRSWDKAYNQLTRVLYFVSGIFYVPAMMPDWARDALAWNPLLHAIDWFRTGFFQSYQPHWLDRSYLAILAVLALLFGLALERGLRRRLRAPL